MYIYICMSYLISCEYLNNLNKDKYYSGDMYIHISI